MTNIHEKKSELENLRAQMRDISQEWCDTYGAETFEDAATAAVENEDALVAVYAELQTKFEILRNEVELAEMKDKLRSGPKGRKSGTKNSQKQAFLDYVLDDIIQEVRETGEATRDAARLLNTAKEQADLVGVSAWKDHSKGIVWAYNAMKDALNYELGTEVDGLPEKLYCQLRLDDEDNLELYMYIDTYTPRQRSKKGEKRVSFNLKAV